MLYTIGYRGYSTPNDFADAILSLSPIRVLDCRAKSRCRSGFGRRQLAALLGERLEWRGDILGGFGHTTDDGIMLADELARSPLVHVAFCACEAAGDCHLHHDVARRLSVDVHHVFRSEVVTSTELRRLFDGDLPASSGYVSSPFPPMSLHAASPL